MDYIKKVDSLKADLIKKNLNIDTIVDLINIDKSFDELEILHLFLIKKVSKIIANEKSKINSNACKLYSNAFECINNCEDGKIGGKIYFLNNDAAIYYIFGDIHSDSISIFEFLKTLDFINKIQNDQNIRLVFLGDYIDRGKNPYKVLELILILKYIFPQNIFLLRGNHDGGTLISENEYKLCVGRNDNTTDDDYFIASLFNTLIKLNKPLTLLKEYLKFFNNLCHIAFIKNGSEIVMCVHGGIPRPKSEAYEHLRSISDLYNEKIVDDLSGSIIHNMLWSDPAEDTTLYRSTRRFYFYRNHFDSFINKFFISKVVRGHQAFDEGYKEFFDGKLISIFSSGKSVNINHVTAYDNIIPCVLMLHNGNQEIIRL